ncbi:Probable transcriptional regulatory protein TetR [Mycobacteroides abscessus subsp. abscessus]|nr:Probable transcriptional regulatory protein TetR [Mycobacteroides abscessus subsp. abscessus]
MAAGSISYHFGGKRGFYLAVVEQAAEEFWSDLIQMRGPALERLSDGIGKFLDRAQQEKSPAPSPPRCCVRPSVGPSPSWRESCCIGCIPTRCLATPSEI